MLHLITEENQHEYKIRFIGALIAFPIPLNFLEFEANIFYAMMLFVFGFPLWGIMFNVMAYFATNLVEGFIPKLTREQIYRCLVLGHAPMFLAVFSIPALRFISFQQFYLWILWGLSWALSIYLISRTQSGIDQ